jgi:hypothetical protein
VHNRRQSFHQFRRLAFIKEANAAMASYFAVTLPGALQSPITLRLS